MSEQEGPSAWACVVSKAKTEEEIRELEAALREIQDVERHRTLNLAADDLDDVYGLAAAVYSDELRRMSEEAR